MTGGTNATASTFSSASGYKCGTGKGGGSMTVTIPAGATVLSVYVAGWSGDNPTVSISRSSGTISSSSVSPTCDSGISGGNSSYTLANAESTYLQTFTLSSVNSETTVTFSTSAKNKRFGVWGAKICYSPTSPTNTTIGSTTATLGWSDAKNVNSYEVYYSTSSTAPTASSSGTTTTSKSINLTSLTSSQQYYWWVRAYDSYCKSAWVAGSSFTTTASGCTNNINIGKGSESHGTFELSKSGSQATCSGLSVVVTPDADDHYHVGSVSATTGETGTDNGDGTWTITYAADVTGESTINVVFAEDTKYTLNYHDGSGDGTKTNVYEGTNLITALGTPAASCDKTSTAFVGWTTTEIATKTDTKPTLVAANAVVNSTTEAEKYYAVYAQVGEGGTPTDKFSVTLNTANPTAPTGYTLTQATEWKNSTHRQDGSNDPAYVKIYHSSTKLFSTLPTSITIKAGLYGGTARDMTSDGEDSYPYVFFTDNAGNEITGSARAICTSVTASSEEKSVNMDVSKAANAYGIGIRHKKISGFNLRYSSLAVSYANVTYTNYVTTCCTELGSINGSVDWTNPTTAVVTWDKLDDQVSEWALSWSPNTDGSSITSAIADKGTTQKTATVSGLACGTEYTFTLTPTIKSGVCTVETNPTIVETSPKYQITMTGSGTVSNGSFTVNGEKAAKVYSCNGTDNVAIVATPAPGYELDAWSITKDASSTAISPAAATASTTFSMPAEAVTVGVSFKAKKYAITYKDEGNNDYSGSNLASLPNEHTYNVATALVDGVKDGYSFVGWFTDEDCMVSAGSSIAANSITAATTLYAKWAEAGTKRVTISTPSHGSISVTYTGMESALTSGYRDIDDDTELTITATPADGYQLSSLKIGDDEFTSGNKHTLTAAITISATFSAIEYGITYHLDGGTNHKDNPAKFTIESSAITLGTPTKTGYTFGGWYVNEDLAVGHEASTPAISAASTGAKAFWAKWTANESTITWDANEGSVEPTSSKYTYDGSTVALPTPTRDHYVFDGWFTEVSGGSKITEIGTTNKPEADVTYHAHWHKENYTVTWEVGGSPYTTGVSEANNNADYNNTVTAPTKPNDNSLNACQANGKFMGWSETKILSNDPVNGSSNISALGLFTTTSPAITKNTTFYAVFANGETSHKSAKFDASNTTATPATSNTNEWKHSASNILLKLSSGQRYTSGTPNTFTVYKGNGNYAQVTTATGQTVTSIDVECSSDDYKVRSVSSGASIGSAITSGTYPVYPLTGTFANPFQLKENNTAQIRIVSITINYDTTAYADYITECAPLTCSAPQSLASTAGKNGATISWSAQEVGTAAKYQYAVWADGDDEPTSGYSETTELTAEVSGLMSNTDYNWKVRTVCTGEDGESEFAKSTFTTGSVALTFSVPTGVSSVTASTSASALPSADVPDACAGCWSFAGWSSNENATSVEYAAGGTYKFDGDKTLYAVYGKGNNTYKLIDDVADLTANEYYVVTYNIENGKADAMTNEVVGSDYVSSSSETVESLYINNPSSDAIWKLTGSSSAWRLQNIASSKYMDLSDYNAAPIAVSTTDNLNITLYDAETKRFNIGSVNAPANFLQMYNSGWGVDNDHDGYYSAYIYKRQLGSLTTAPDCSGHTVEWYVAGAKVRTDEGVSSCDGVASLPSVDVADVRCKTEGTTFMGWSETNVGVTPTSDADEIAALNLFTDAADAPAITADKEFYAVFAQGTPALVTPQTVTYTISAKNTLTTTGTAPTGSSAAIVETYGTSKQMTSGCSQTLTLTDFGDWKITRIVLSMKSNQNGGGGSLSYSTDGGTNFSTLASGNFNTDAWNGSYTTNYTNVTKNVNFTTVANKDVVIKIEANANSLYCGSYAITYEPIITYGDYFTECCPQRAITIADLDEAFGTIEADIELACEGEQVTLSKTENHYNFSSWKVYKSDDENTTVDVDNNNQFYMPAYPVTVEAEWNPKNYKATVASEDNNKGTVSVIGGSIDGDDFQVAYSSPLTLTADPVDEDHYFQNWTVTPAIPELDLTQNPLVITMPGNNIAVTANFGAVAYPALTLETNEAYTLTATLANGDPIANMGAIRSGTALKVSYVLNGQNEKTGWTLTPATTYGESENYITFNMPSEALHVALAVRPYYTLGLSAENGSISSVEIDDEPQTPTTTSYNVHAGEIVEVVATPTDDTYKFIGWEKTGIDENNFTANGAEAMLGVATSNMTLKAVFAAKETKTLTLMVCGKAQETINALEGTSIHSLVSAKTAPALTGYTFMGWSAAEDGAAISQSADVTLDDNMTIYAVYKKKAYYQKVTATSGITDGQYLIVYEDGDLAFNGGLSTLDAVSNTISVSTANKKIAITSETTAAEFTISATENGYSIKSASDYYIGQTSNANGLASSTSVVYDNTIGFSDGDADIVSGGAYLRYNSASNQNRFRYYKSESYSNQKAIQLYKKVAPGANESNPTTVVANNEVLVIDADATLNNLTVEAGGKVTNTNNLTVNNLTIKSEAGKSGQVTNGNKISVNGALYMDVTFFKGANTLDATTAGRWYMISAPFDVNLSDGFTLTDGTAMHFGVDDNALTFDLFEYDGKKRGETGVTGWKRAQGKMKAGTACLIGFNPGQPTTIRLKAASTTLTEKTSITLQAFDGDATNQNWNGVANPTLHYTDLNKDVQTYNNEDGENGRKYIAYSASSTSFVVGTAFFVQETGTLTLSAATHGSLRAPKRESERYEACVQIFRQEATEFADQMYVRASETASNEYEQGHDMITWNGTTGNTAMIWAENYGKRLAIEEAPLVSNQASYALGIFAPKAGTYRIAATSEDDADLYLTYEGAIIWNLSMGEYTVDLNKGTTNGYGLLLQAKAPQVVTGVDEVDAETGVQKIIIDEHVFILRGGQMYDVTGKMVK